MCDTACEGFLDHLVSLKGPGQCQCSLLLFFLVSLLLRVSARQNRWHIAGQYSIQQLATVSIDFFYAMPGTVVSYSFKLACCVFSWNGDILG